MIDSIGIKAACSTLDSMDFIPLLKQEFGQITTVLPSNPSNQSFFHITEQAFTNISLRTNLDDTSYPKQQKSEYTRWLFLLTIRPEK